MDANGTITITEEQLLANSSDIEGDVSLESVNYTGSFGELTANDDGTYTFEPAEDFAGNLLLDVTVVDEDGATADTKAGIEIFPAAPAPVQSIQENLKGQRSWRRWW